MVINFTGGGGMTPAQVQEMIDASLDFMTGVVNLSTATNEQVKTALNDPDRWLFSLNYSGETYLESKRSINSDSSATYYTSYFYVPGAEASSKYTTIYDRMTWVEIVPSTGERIYPASGSIYYAPDTVYYLNNMNAEQLKVLASRASDKPWTSRMNSSPRFTAKWFYNNRMYIACAGSETTSTGTLIGSSFDASNMSVLYDIVSISSEGVITHRLLESNITLTDIV